jgi:phenylalanyl-tRNA synthetase beta chain
MPTVNVRRARLFHLLGRSFTDSAFDDLCFQYGIELDSVTTEAEISGKAPVAETAASAAGVVPPAGAVAPAAASASSASAADDSTVVYKIEIPANRYDLLCVEGIARALRVFLQIDPAGPVFVVAPPASGTPLQIIQTAATKEVRPFVVGAVLRGVTFTPESFASFIDLQDKLHQNIGRKRTLIAIGTHDLDTIQAPFTYTAEPKKDIKFIPLYEEKAMDVEELFNYYQNKTPPSHLKPYLHITERFNNHPVIYDAQRIVCSLPPIINGEHSKIKLDTKNVFIEVGDGNANRSRSSAILSVAHHFSLSCSAVILQCTGTDLTKLNVTLNQVVTMFSQYCSQPFHIECVEVVDQASGAKKLTPDLSNTRFEARVDYINSAIGINISPEEIVVYLRKMSMEATLNADKSIVSVEVPPTRSDVLQACDLMEDIAISYGFNKVPRTLPQVSSAEICCTH